MITIVAATNRPDSMTELVANICLGIYNQKKVEAQILSLKQLPRDFAFSELYGQRSDDMGRLLETYVEKAEKFVFIIPEYNGSFPGVLKTFLDGSSPQFFRGKKAGMIGISDGHSGNQRGLEHLAGILFYMKMFVHYAQPKISAIDKLINAKGELDDARANKLLNDHADFMITF